MSIESLLPTLAVLESVTRAVEDAAPEAVIHLAALSDVAASWREMERYFAVNVLGTEHVLDAVGDSARVVVASSAEVYGAVGDDDLPVTEAQAMRPATPYALTKAAAERLALRRNAVVARSFNLVGPGQDPRFALPSFAHQLRAIKDGEREAVLRVGNLDAARDFVHVDDAADAYRVMAEHGAVGQCYNLASGTAIVMRSALDRLIATAGVDVAIVQDPDRLRPSDVPVMAGIRPPFETWAGRRVVASTRRWATSGPRFPNGSRRPCERIGPRRTSVVVFRRAMRSLATSTVR